MKKGTDMTLKQAIEIYDLLRGYVDDRIAVSFDDWFGHENEVEYINPHGLFAEPFLDCKVSGFMVDFPENSIVQADDPLPFVTVLLSRQK